MRVIVPLLRIYLNYRTNQVPKFDHLPDRSDYKKGKLRSASDTCSMVVVVVAELGMRSADISNQVNKKVRSGRNKITCESIDYEFVTC